MLVLVWLYQSTNQSVEQRHEKQFRLAPRKIRQVVPGSDRNAKERAEQVTHSPGIARTHRDAAATGHYADNPAGGSAELVLDPHPARRRSLRRLNLLAQFYGKGWFVWRLRCCSKGGGA